MNGTKTLERIKSERENLLGALEDLQKWAEQEATSGYRHSGLGLADKGVKIAEIQAQLHLLHALEYTLNQEIHENEDPEERLARLESEATVS